MELLARLQALPAARPLLERVADIPGVYVVGGAVRDLLLGGQPTDLDLVVERDASRVAERLGGTLVVHDRFGTSTVRVDGFTYDIATAREETYERPGALPDVSPATLDEDLKRRDFTVNAIAIALDGTVIALPGALEDVDERRLRVLHEQSFIDDPTRLLRLARYASRLGFAIEPHTLELAQAAVKAGALGTVSGTRIGSELRLLVREPDAVAAFQTLRELGLDQALDPGFGLSDSGLARRALALLPDDGRRDLLVLAVAARELKDPAKLLDRLGFEAGDRDAVVSAARHAPAMAEALGRANSPSEIAAAVGNGGPELVALAGALRPAGPAREWLGNLRHVRLEIDGADLLAAGVPEGPAVGRGLRAALRAKLDGRTVGRESELDVALRTAREPGH